MVWRRLSEMAGIVHRSDKVLKEQDDLFGGGDDEEGDDEGGDDEGGDDEGGDEGKHTHQGRPLGRCERRGLPDPRRAHG